MLQIGEKYQSLKPPCNFDVSVYPKVVNNFVEKKNISLWNSPPFSDFRNLIIWSKGSSLLDILGIFFNQTGHVDNIRAFYKKGFRS